MNSENRKRLTEKADAAFRQAAAKVVERARWTGTPVIVWEQGSVQTHSVEELERQEPGVGLPGDQPTGPGARVENNLRHPEGEG